MGEQVIDFRNGKITVLFKQLFFPTVLGMLSMSAVTTIDGIFVGHGVGSDGIAAVNICVPLLMGLMGVGLMMGSGCSVMASIYLSQGKRLLARIGVTQALLFVTLISLIAGGGVMVFPERVARLLGASELLMPMVVDYLVWFAPSLLFELWMAVALFALRLDGAPKLAMWCNVIAAVVNILLDWLFIFPFGWGVRGAALATSVSCLAGAAVAVVYLGVFARNTRLCVLRLNRKDCLLWIRNTVAQCKIGLSTLFGEMTMALLLFVGNHVFMHYLGDEGVGAFGLSCYFLPFVFMIGNAIAQSVQPIISYNFGTGSRERVHTALRVLVMAAVGCGVVSTAGFVFLPEVLVGVFLPLDDAAARIAIDGFPYYGVGFVFFILNLTIIGYYQSIERIKPAITFAMLRGLFFLVPCFVVLPKVAGVTGIWLALPVSEILTSLCMVVMLWKQSLLPHSPYGNTHVFE